MLICIIAVLVKASWIQCPLHNQKVNKPSFHGASCQLAPLNSQAIWTQNTVFTNSSVNGSKCSLWGMKMTALPKLVEFSFIPCISASVIECRSIGSCSSSGLCAGSWSHVSTFSCYPHCLPLTQNASSGLWKQFSRTCAIIQIKYVLSKLCHLPQYCHGSRDPYSYWGRWHSMVTHA